jgi:hypothetical protein
MNGRQAERRAEIVRQVVDWTRLVALAELHGLSSLVRFHLRHDSAIPETVQNQLERTACLNAQRNLLLTARLLEVLTILEQRNIAAIPFKGPMLAALVYGDLSLRLFGDLDVFVPKNDVMRARQALLERGYSGTFPFAAGQQRTFLRSDNQLVLTGTDQVTVELHWNVTPRRFPLQMDLDEVWHRGEHVTFAGKRVANLSSEDLLILLCVHGAKHQWRRIGWVCDIAELLRSYPSIEWDHVRSRAHRVGAARMVRLGTLLATDLLGAEVPAAVDEWIKADPVAISLSTGIRQRYYADRGGRPDLLKQALFRVAARERWRDKFSYVWRGATTPTSLEWDMLPLPSQLAFLYSFMRPARLIAKHGAQALNKIARAEN